MAGKRRSEPIQTDTRFEKLISGKKNLRLRRLERRDVMED